MLTANITNIHGVGIEYTKIWQLVQLGLKGMGLIPCIEVFLIVFLLISKRIITWNRLLTSYLLNDKNVPSFLPITNQLLWHYMYSVCMKWEDIYFIYSIQVLFSYNFMIKLKVVSLDYMDMWKTLEFKYSFIQSINQRYISLHVLIILFKQWLLLSIYLFYIVSQNALGKQNITFIEPKICILFTYLWKYIRWKGSFFANLFQ